jgi:hypothetical protein
MTEERVEYQYFEHLPEYSVAICKACRHGVLPSYVESYLHRTYKIKQSQACDVAERVGDWPSLIEYASELKVPSCIIPPIPQVLIYTDGWLCQVTPT